MPEHSKVRDKLKVILNPLRDIPMEKQTVIDFLEGKKPVVVFTIDEDRMHSSKEILTMLLMATYRFKTIETASNPYFVILDEFQDFNTEKNSPLNQIMRKSRKRGLNLILASTGFSADDSGLSEIIRNAGTKVFFQQDNDRVLALLGKQTEKSELKHLSEHTCVIEGYLYSKSNGKNVTVTVCGEPVSFEHSFYDKCAFLEEYPIMPDTADESEDTLNDVRQNSIEPKTDIDAAVSPSSLAVNAVETIEEKKEQEENEPKTEANTLQNEEESSATVVSSVINAHDETDADNTEKKVALEEDHSASYSAEEDAEQPKNDAQLPLDEHELAASDDNEDKEHSDDKSNTDTSLSPNMPQFDSNYLRKRISDIYVVTNVSEYNNNTDSTALPAGVYIKLRYHTSLALTQI